jgi:hypothetical protein
VEVLLGGINKAGALLRPTMNLSAPLSVPWNLALERDRIQPGLIQLAPRST